MEKHKKMASQLKFAFTLQVNTTANLMSCLQLLRHTSDVKAWDRKATFFYRSLIMTESSDLPVLGEPHPFYLCPS